MNPFQRNVIYCITMMILTSICSLEPDKTADTGDSAGLEGHKKPDGNKENNVQVCFGYSKKSRMG